MAPYIIHELCGLPCELHGDGSMYVPELKTLFIADLHVGKGGQFRKEGIPTPIRAHQQAMAKLECTLNRQKAEQVIILGDLFEGWQNRETKDLRELLQKYPSTKFILVRGNHDFDPPDWTELELHLTYRAGPFICLHDPPGCDFDKNIPFNIDKAEQEFPDIQGQNMLLCGHLHPGAILKGRGRTRARLKAFFFNDQLGILPAFGALTGHYSLQEKGQYFGIIENSILNLGSWPK